MKNLVRPKKMVEDTRRFTVPVSMRPQSLFGREICTWQELISTNGVLPDDIVTGLSWGDEDDEDVLNLVVIRKREETDKEYRTRIKNEDKIKKQMDKISEEHDRYEYERLKKKYEG